MFVSYDAGDEQPVKEKMSVFLTSSHIKAVAIRQVVSSPIKEDGQTASSSNTYSLTYQHYR